MGTNEKRKHFIIIISLSLRTVAAYTCDSVPFSGTCSDVEEESRQNPVILKDSSQNGTFGDSFRELAIRSLNPSKRKEVFRAIAKHESQLRDSWF